MKPHFSVLHFLVFMSSCTPSTLQQTCSQLANNLDYCSAEKGQSQPLEDLSLSGEWVEGRYAYNYAGTGTHDYTRYYFGLGPMITWGIPPVAEAQIKVPSEMLAISDSAFLSAGANHEPGGDDALISGLASGHPFDPARHGKTYNQLWCDGHVAAMNPWILFNRTNSAALWNSDHEPHPEGWSP